MKVKSLFLAKNICNLLYPTLKVVKTIDPFTFYTENISLKIPACSTLLTEFNASENNIKFFKNDKEMCIKYPEIWQMQIQNEENNLKEIEQKLITLGQENQINLAKVLDSFTNDVQNLTDLLKE